MSARLLVISKSEELELSEVLRQRVPCEIEMARVFAGSLHHEAYDLIVLDVPEAQRLTLLRRFGKKRRCPVLVLAGLSDHSPETLVFNKLADDVLIKPITPLRLLLSVKLLLKLRRLELHFAREPHDAA